MSKQTPTRSAKESRPDFGWRPARACLCLGLLLASLGQGEVIVYEGNSLPESVGWEHELAGTPGADRQLVGGWLVVSADLPEGWSEPTGNADYYRWLLGEFVEVERFFVEWRVITNAPAELLDFWALPVGIAAGGQGVLYQAAITDSRVRLLRRLTLPIILVDFKPVQAHVFRLEMQGGTSYTWYVDGLIAETGVPVAAFPDPSAEIIWGVRRWYVDSITAWDYFRFGVIPADGSGDFDSDGVVTHFDFYFFHDCLTKDGPGLFGGPGQSAGPGCRFADFDRNGSVDLLDFAAFANQFGPGE